MEAIYGTHNILTYILYTPKEVAEAALWAMYVSYIFCFYLYFGVQYLSIYVKNLVRKSYIFIPPRHGVFFFC